MSLRTPTPPGYGNSTRSLTLEAIEVALAKDQARNTDVDRKETKEVVNMGTSKHSEIS